MNTDFSKMTFEKLMETSNTDTRKKINRSPKDLPHDVLQSIVNGITIEQIDSLIDDGYQIFTYLTQITIHCNANENEILEYVNGYKNLFVNKNKTLGVRWTAIDAEKKSKIRHLTRLIPYDVRNVYSYRNSMGDELIVVFEESDKDKAIEYYKNFPTASFIGGIGLHYVKESFYNPRPFYAVKIELGGIYEDTISTFTNYLFGGLTEPQILEMHKKEEERKAKEILDDTVKSYPDRLSKVIASYTSAYSEINKYFPIYCTKKHTDLIKNLKEREFLLFCRIHKPAVPKNKAEYFLDYISYTYFAITKHKGMIKRHILKKYETDGIANCEFDNVKPNMRKDFIDYTNNVDSILNFKTHTVLLLSETPTALK